MKKMSLPGSGAMLLALLCATTSAAAQTPRVATAPGPVHQGAQFTPGNVRPFLNDLERMLKDLQSVQTTEQAQRYEAALLREATALSGRAVAFKQAVEHFAFLTVQGGVKQENRDAQSLVPQVLQLGPQVEAQMIRVGKLNPRLKVAFKQYRDLQK